MHHSLDTHAFSLQHTPKDSKVTTLKRNTNARVGVSHSGGYDSTYSSSKNALPYDMGHTPRSCNVVPTSTKLALNTARFQ